jgi:hypothetical protein
MRGDYQRGGHVSTVAMPAAGAPTLPCTAVPGTVETRVFSCTVPHVALQTTCQRQTSPTWHAYCRGYSAAAGDTQVGRCARGCKTPVFRPHHTKLHCDTHLPCQSACVDPKHHMLECQGWACWFYLWGICGWAKQITFWVSLSA